MEAIDFLIDKIDQTANPSVIGLDPKIENIPQCIKQRCLTSYGNTVEAASEAIFEFNKGILASIHQIIPAVKLQMACYELYGSYGIKAFERTVKLAKDYGLAVIDDSKRNDIGSTAALYALGHLGSAPLIEGRTEKSPVDFLTVNPWLGEDGILPFIEECKKHEKGIFILVKTSNPSSVQYQGSFNEENPLFHKVSKDVHLLSQQCMGTRGYSSIGSVVGATHPKEAEQLRKEMPNCYFLVPGYGAQGGSAEDTIPSFNTDGYGALINSSRNVIFAWQQQKYLERFPHEEDYTKAAAAAAQEMKEDLLQSLRNAGKLPKTW